MTRSSTLWRELAAIALTLFAVFLAMALADGGLAPVAGTACGESRGWTGPAGACLRWMLVQVVGLPAAILLILAPLVHALRLFGRLEASTDRSWLLFFAGLVLLLPIGISLSLGALPENAIEFGLWGGFSAFYLKEALGFGGAWVFLVLAVSALAAATLAWNPIRMVLARRDAGAAPVAIMNPTVEMETRRSRRKKVDAGVTPGSLVEPPPEEMPAVDLSLMNDPVVRPDAEVDMAVEGGADRGKGKRKRATKSEQSSARDEQIAAEIDASGTLPARVGELLPPTTLLNEPPPHSGEAGRRELDAMGTKLMEALRTFRVDGELVGRTTGPVVTQFEIAPSPGVKVRQFANLANDLALAMRAPSIRIVAPIPGKGAVGVEVPNPSAEIVAFRELIDHAEFRLARALPIALGKDLEGRPVIADLAKMPHLLIAGATGSGKSVCVNTLVTSLIYRHTPRTLRFLMVDPKMVELSVYNTLPHLRHKVVTDNRDAAAVLKWAVLEMQERYELLAANGARNIQDFNRKVQDGAKLKGPKPRDVALAHPDYTGDVLPYIVVVIDELADLMMTVQGEVETPLAMLAQKARAIGIHLILATQRPSVNVITGLIKANFPSRIAFRVASQVDSRTILDGIGAEALLGNGDMLFIPPGKSEPARLQGAYISSEETERLMAWYDEQRAIRRAALEAQGIIPEEPTQLEADILETVRARELVEQGGPDDEGEEDADRDKLFREAAEVVVQHRQGSTSLLQRRLKVGYGRAARIIDQLHAAGVLGPPDGSKPRDVLVGLEDLDRICGPR